MSDINHILDRLRRHESMFDLSTDLGEDLCEIASVAAHAALLAGEDFEGNPLPPLSPAYEAWKSVHYPGLPIGFRDLEMGRLEHFRGEVEMERDSAVVTYGINEQARDEFAWFNEGDRARNRPPRRVWGLTAEAVRLSAERLDDHFRDNL